MKKHFAEYNFFCRAILKRIDGSPEELLAFQKRQVENAKPGAERRIKGMELFLMQSEMAARRRN